MTVVITSCISFLLVENILSRIFFVAFHIIFHDFQYYVYRGCYILNL